jgi:hypothetical protein
MRKCSHEHKIWSNSEFSYLHCQVCKKLLRKVWTPNFDHETGRTFIAFNDRTGRKQEASQCLSRQE